MDTYIRAWRQLINHLARFAQLLAAAAGQTMPATKRLGCGGSGHGGHWLARASAQ